MTKITFHYCPTHKQDEAYMQSMCARGWAAQGLVEGFWRFAPCSPNEFCYRICYLRGLSAHQVEQRKQTYAQRGIEFVSRYSFWAIFRSREEFSLYTPEEEQEICWKMYAPMPVGAAVSWLLFLVGVFLSLRFSPWFWILTVLIGVYGGVCTWLAVAYHKLLSTLS